MLSTLFTILVLVAIVTTLMASPIFDFVYGRHGSTTRQSPPEQRDAPPDGAPVPGRENAPSESQ
jgi:hypothetical protein